MKLFLNEMAIKQPDLLGFIGIVEDLFLSISIFLSEQAPRTLSLDPQSRLSWLLIGTWHTCEGCCPHHHVIIVKPAARCSLCKNDGHKDSILLRRSLGSPKGRWHMDLWFHLGPAQIQVLLSLSNSRGLQDPVYGHQMRNHFSRSNNTWSAAKHLGYPQNFQNWFGLDLQVPGLQPKEGSHALPLKC